MHDRRPNPSPPGSEYDVFISYTGADRPWVQDHLLPALTGAQVRWFTEAEFALGAPWLDEFERAVKGSSRTLLVLSPAYLAQQDMGFVNLLAQTYGVETRSWPVIPLILRPVERLPTRLGLLVALDATDPDAWPAALARLCKTLGRSVQDPASLAVPPPAATPAKSGGRAGSNPFIVGSTVPSAYFYGRQAQQAAVRNRIGALTAQCISVVGLRRSGKSSVLRYIRERTSEFCPTEQQPLVVSLDLQAAHFHTPAGLLEGLRRAIERQTGAAPWPAAQNDDPWAVQDGLEALRDGGRRLIVLLDDLERIGERLEEFHDWGEDWRAKASAGYFALLIATTRPLDEIYKVYKLTSPFGNLFTTTVLGAFAEDEWRALVGDGFARGGGEAAGYDLEWIADLAGGLPYYTQMAAALLWQGADHPSARDEFVDQAMPRFAELWAGLRENERHALRHAAGAPGLAAPPAGVRATLQDHGLLRPDGRLFSSAFAAFVREPR